MPISIQLVARHESVHAWIGAPALQRERAIELNLARFPAKVQPRLRAFAREHQRTGELTVSFPALAVAIALSPKNPKRDDALAAVIAGAPLARIAAIAKTPFWLRALPPEAFSAALPSLPEDPEFSRSIPNHLPKDWKHAERWFDAVAVAYATADSAVALWFARECLREGRVSPVSSPRLVALFAWFCAHGHIRLTNAVPKWRPQMAWTAALSAALDWRDELLVSLYIGDGVTDAWFEPARFGAYEFVAVSTVTALAEEAAAMSNCVRTYGYDVASHQRRIWSVRKHGQRVATLSLRAPNGFIPTVDELSGPGNALVDADTLEAVHRWLCAQDIRRFAPSRSGYTPAAIDQRRWRAVWRDWWLAKRRVPHWLPLRGAQRILYAL